MNIEYPILKLRFIGKSRSTIKSRMLKRKKPDWSKTPVLRLKTISALSSNLPRIGEFANKKLIAIFCSFR